MEPTKDLDNVEILQRSPDHSDAVTLLRAFYDEQVGRYGFAESIDLNSVEYSSPTGVFVVVYHRGRPVGCGCYRQHVPHPGTVEIKKTYLDPSVRGRGIGRALLWWLECHATAGGATQVIPETGVRNAAALRLFAAAGYQPTARYVAGRPPQINRAFTKNLTQVVDQQPVPPPGGTATA